jgi:ubiquinone/menaquinone biosynthesis C-methylase UbiE
MSHQDMEDSAPDDETPTTDRWRNPPRFHSRDAERETAHTLSLLEPHLDGCASVLDIGCGSAYVAWQLAAVAGREVHAVDVADFRRVPLPNFALFDGLHLPYPDGRFDLVVFSFVLHHVPDVYKPLLLAEARRVARRRVVVLEDTPETWLDRCFSWGHGEWFRRKVGNRVPFGFLSAAQWKRLFTVLRMEPTHIQPLSRWCRSALQPFARTVFVLDATPALSPARGRS